ncbi:cold shock domain-containing protein [Actinomadura sp. LD22]|uniref:Cold shock domain-containing protein n=1 Tax=Actinomadura physcomitrii TaxID=2650748 RepID=A0A6I4MIP0_9ACTN|nr:cold shock domain-containing protein [Actinomadura physcomitrii]MWA04760.1 cold shock domain-containing protein [Actinomadura physcomitrii]
MRTGRVLRFDGVRGYGFIVPDGGGDDVFVHANEVLDDKSGLTPGATVEFETVDSERGPKAFGVRILSRAPSSSSSAPRQSSSSQLLDEGLCDVLEPAELREDITELLLSGTPDLTGRQIVSIRESFLGFAKKHGWVEA